MTAQARTAIPPFAAVLHGGLTAAFLAITVVTAIAPSTQAAIVMAGDDDGFQPGDPADIPFLRSPFDLALQWEHNNHVLHAGVGRLFDEAGGNHTFGHSFDGLPIGQISLNDPVLLEVALRSEGPTIDSTDKIQFQLVDAQMPGSFPGSLWAPPMSLPLSLPTFVATYGDGSPPDSGVLTTVDLRTLVSDRGPYIGQTVAETMNNLGHLDVYIDDDTGIDYMRLSFTPVPEPTSLLYAFTATCLFGAAAIYRNGSTARGNRRR